jgi:hypothetical protein
MRAWTPAYGRRFYEVMAAYWPTGESDPKATEVTRESPGLERHAEDRPQQPESVDFNSRLATATGARAARSGPSGDLEVKWTVLAAQFIERGLVDEYHWSSTRSSSGRHAVLPGSTPIGLNLIDTRVFGSVSSTSLRRHHV